MPAEVPRRLRAGWTVKRILATVKHVHFKSKHTSSPSSSFCSPSAAFSLSFQDASLENLAFACSEVFDIFTEACPDDDTPSSDTEQSSPSPIHSDSSSSSSFTAPSMCSSLSPTPLRPLPPIPNDQHSSQHRLIRVLPVLPQSNPSQRNLRPTTSLLQTRLNQNYGMLAEICDSPTLLAAPRAPASRSMLGVRTDADKGESPTGSIDWDLLEELLGAAKTPS